MNLKSKIESLLFVSNKPLSVGKIAQFVKSDKKSIKQALEELVDEYRLRAGGIIIVKNLMRYQMMSGPQNSEIARDFLKSEISGELTQPALETLTIIAYRGPISKPELEQIRGVNCGLILKNLFIRGLAEARPGKSIKKEEGYLDKKLLDEELYYNVTFDFLKYLGVSSVEELPDYNKLSEEKIINE